MLLNDYSHDITQWRYEDIWEMIGKDPNQYPKLGTVKHFKWRDVRSRIMALVNSYFEREKKTIRIRVAFGTKDNGDFVPNKWCVVPEDEALNWFALEAAKKTLSPLALSMKRAIGYSAADNFPPEVKLMFSNIAAMLGNTESVMLGNLQAINGLDGATIAELQEWKRRKDKKHQKLLNK
jgi:hypothetical protein